MPEPTKAELAGEIEQRVRKVERWTHVASGASALLTLLCATMLPILLAQGCNLSNAVTDVKVNGAGQETGFGAVRRRIA